MLARMWEVAGFGISGSACSEYWALVGNNGILYYVGLLREHIPLFPTKPNKFGVPVQAFRSCSSSLDSLSSCHWASGIETRDLSNKTRASKHIAHKYIVPIK